MRRPSSPYGSSMSMSFGPGPLSPALKALIGANVLLFIVQLLTDGYGWGLTWTLGLMPADVLFRARIWELGTYMFLHGGMFHLLFNMLALWMFGTELERMWGTRYFLKFYFVTGIGAGVLTVLFSLLPFGFAQQLQHGIIIGASGAIYGLLLAYGLYFPNRPIYMYMVFRRDHGRARLLLVDRRAQRRRERDAPGRPDRRVPVPEERPRAPDRGAEVPLPQVEDQPEPREVRCLHRRAGEGLGSAGALGGQRTVPTPQP
jgi:membrane associated rhomboid family serine protease